MKKRILIFHPALAPYRIDLFNALSNLYDLHVVFLYDNLWSFKFNQELLLSQCTFKMSFLLKGPKFKGRVFRFGMYKKIQSFNPDIILGYEYSFTTQYLILLKRVGLISQKIGIVTDDNIEICHNVQSGIRLYARKYSLKYLDVIVVLSKDVFDYYFNKLKFKNGEIIVSPIFQNPNRLRERSKDIKLIADKYISKHNLRNKKVLLFVGRLIPEKALPLFLNNIHTLFQQERDLVFVIVGEGNEMVLLQSIIEQKGLEGKVVLTGKFESEELYGWYMSASGLVLPSLSETFGAVINEALIFGLPVFCSRLAGISSWIKKEHGLIFDPLNSKETMMKLKLFLNKVEPVTNLKLSSRPCLMDFSIDKFNKEWRKLMR